ncbi:hypothetical protein LUZ63_006187 [Rhynchospora breviuscula]|uniref:S-acyltransferase n=1 Tax=Rhynchospora breviuscula TaxID=2022672 RepID=A0A9Q0CPF2_9POAL|nr:hypothetical protein LUZ63_006187 [Rhynchospora breviuscula]
MVQWALVLHGLCTATVVVSFLCGQWPIFEGTFIERLHYFLTFGAYDYFLRFVGKIFGSRAKNCVLGVERYCCERPNPTLQIFYLAIIGVTYVIIAKSSFKYIPGYYVGEYHKYLSVVAVVVGLVLFVLTSFSDPGTVTAENASRYISAYPYDDLIFVERECSTCKITSRPARAKHCKICDRCVARFDHHCGWMNNCIGEKNTRYFVAFLFWHFLICLYGAVVLGLILAGQLQERKIIYILTVYYGVENSFSALFPHVVQYFLASYNAQILLTVFLGIISLLLAGFFGYHAHLCLTNMTTNETFKWQDYISWKRKVNEAKTSETALKESLNIMNGTTPVPQSKWRTFCKKSPLQKEEPIVVNNVYNKGVFCNIYEILVPLSQRRSFFHSKDA